MTTQWNTRELGADGKPPVFDDQLAEDELVILLRGKNSFGDRIYSYLQLTVKDLKRLQLATLKGEIFNPSDYGTVVAAGQGEPSAEVKQEIESTYKVLSPGAQDAPEPVPANAESKDWDEF